MPCEKLTNHNTELARLQRLQLTFCHMLGKNRNPLLYSGFNTSYHNALNTATITQHALKPGQRRRGGNARQALNAGCQNFPILDASVLVQYGMRNHP